MLIFLFLTKFYSIPQIFVVTGGGNRRITFAQDSGVLRFDSTEVLLEGSKGWTQISGSLPSARAGLRMVRTSHNNQNNWLIATGMYI